MRSLVKYQKKKNAEYGILTLDKSVNKFKLPQTENCLSENSAYFTCN